MDSWTLSAPLHWKIVDSPMTSWWLCKVFGSHQLHWNSTLISIGTEPHLSHDPVVFSKHAPLVLATHGSPWNQRLSLFSHWNPALGRHTEQPFLIYANMKERTEFVLLLRKLKVRPGFDLMSGYLTYFCLCFVRRCFFSCLEDALCLRLLREFTDISKLQHPVQRF